MKAIKAQIQEAQQILSTRIMNKNIPRQIIMKLLKTRVILKATTQMHNTYR